MESLMLERMSAAAASTAAIPADPDASDLAAWVAHGDRGALSGLFTRHAGAALALATRRLGHASDAEDAVQEAFIAAMRGARGFRAGPGTVRGWLLTAVLNACAQQRRERGRRVARERLAASAAPLSAPVPDPDLPEALARALAELPERQRQAIELRYLADLDYREIAAALGRKEGTVRTQVERGLAALRASCARAGLATSPAAVMAAIAMLPLPVAASGTAARCAQVAATGPTAGPPAAVLAQASVIAACCALAVGCWWLLPRPAPAGTDHAAPAAQIVDQPVPPVPPPAPIVHQLVETVVTGALPWAGLAGDGRQLLIRTAAGAQAIGLADGRPHALPGPADDGMASAPLATWPGRDRALWCAISPGTVAPFLWQQGAAASRAPLWHAGGEPAALHLLWAPTGQVALLDRARGRVVVCAPDSGAPPVAAQPVAGAIGCWTGGTLVVVEPGDPPRLRVLWAPGLDPARRADLALDLPPSPVAEAFARQISRHLDRAWGVADSVVARVGDDLVQARFASDAAGVFHGWRADRTRMWHLDPGDGAVVDAGRAALVIVHQAPDQGWQATTRPLDGGADRAPLRLDGLDAVFARLATDLPLTGVPPPGVGTAVHPLLARQGWVVAIADRWLRYGTGLCRHRGTPVVWDPQGRIRSALPGPGIRWEGDRTGWDDPVRFSPCVRTLVHPAGTVAIGWSAASGRGADDGWSTTWWAVDLAAVAP